MITNEDIDRLVSRVEANLAERLDTEVYIPVKEELEGKIEHSLGIRKEMFKSHIGSELEKLKNELKSQITKKEKNAKPRCC